MTHSPAPWEFREWATEPDPELEALAAKAGRSVKRVPMLTNDGARIIMAGEGGEHRRVALVECQTKYKRGQGHETECAERDANARLIAAAPDLYTSLRELVDWCGQRDDRDDLLPPEKQEAEIARAMRALINASGAQ